MTDQPRSASPWMTAAEAAAYLKRGKRFIVGEIQAGRLRGARIGGRREILTRRDWIDAFVESQAAPVAIAPARGFAVVNGRG